MISAPQLRQLLSENTDLLLVDVREAAELMNDGKIAQAQHLPLSEFETRYTELPKDQAIYLICRSGGRSGGAQAFLLEQGYQQPINVVGGMLAWCAAGYETE